MLKNSTRTIMGQVTVNLGQAQSFLFLAEKKFATIKIDYYNSIWKSVTHWLPFQYWQVLVL